MLIIQRYKMEKKQIYGKIVSKWQVKSISNNRSYLHWTVSVNKPFAHDNSKCQNTMLFIGKAVSEVILIWQSKEWHGRTGRIQSPKTMQDLFLRFRERQNMEKSPQDPLSVGPADRS